MKASLIRAYNARRNQIRRFLGMDEDGGTTTIEFVLWLPIFIAILSIVVDVCFVFLAQAKMYDVASDTARQYAVRTLSTEAAAKTYAEGKGEFNGETPTVTVTENSSEGTVEVVITHNIADIDITGIFSSIASFSSDTISATVYQVVERDGSSL
ncbi:MAG: pilus assembly protein [Rhodobacteraceae bacterium]|nr:pilus assembly protein [Paracoccaceae bacterium]